jgi:hypothetical protein
VLLTLMAGSVSLSESNSPSRASSTIRIATSSYNALVPVSHNRIRACSKALCNRVDLIRAKERRDAGSAVDCFAQLEVHCATRPWCFDDTVHGAFADGSGWKPVAGILQSHGNSILDRMFA